MGIQYMMKVDYSKSNVSNCNVKNLEKKFRSFKPLQQNTFQMDQIFLVRKEVLAVLEENTKEIPLSPQNGKSFQQ